MSEIRVTDIKGETGLDAVNFSKGINVTGIVTATNVSIGSSVTATSFFGSGAGLSGVSAGKILQVVSQTKSDTASQSLASGAWWSYTDTSLRVTLTPSSASNKILLFAQISWSEGSGQWYHFKFEKDGADITGAIGDASSSRQRTTAVTDNQTDNNAGRTQFMMVQVSADNTSSRYYNIALKHTSGATRTLYLNRTASDSDAHGYARPISTITAMEVEV